MADFVAVADLSCLAPGSCRAVQAAGKEVALFNVAGVVLALDNTCLHRGGPLGEGDLEGEVVTCPWHGWQYNVRTGEKCGDPSKKVRQYDVKIEGENILVAL